MKGNNYNEFWRYMREGNITAKSINPQTVTAVTTNNVTAYLTTSIKLSPNPVTNNALINYTVSTTGRYRLDFTMPAVSWYKHYLTRL